MAMGTATGMATEAGSLRIDRARFGFTAAREGRRALPTSATPPVTASPPFDYALAGILLASFSEMVVTVSSAAFSCFRFSPSRLTASVSPSAFAIVIRPV